jgi:hypothetical protein
MRQITNNPKLRATKLAAEKNHLHKKVNPEPRNIEENNFH